MRFSVVMLPPFHTYLEKNFSQRFSPVLSEKEEGQTDSSQKVFDYIIELLVLLDSSAR
jgi:hypothetical protein